MSADVDAWLEQLLEDRVVPVAATETPVRVLEGKLNLDAARISDQVERDLIAHLAELDPNRFEELCALYLRVLRCGEVRVVGAATNGSLGDGGIDVVGTLARPGLPAIKLEVQAKRQVNGVGPRVVTQLRGSLTPGSYGIVLTTGHFTRAAIAEADRSDRSKIKLVEGPELAHVLVESDIAVAATQVTVRRLDLRALHNRLDAEIA